MAPAAPVSSDTSELKDTLLFWAITLILDSSQHVLGTG